MWVWSSDNGIGSDRKAILLYYNNLTWALVCKLNPVFEAVAGDWSNKLA